MLQPRAVIHLALCTALAAGLSACGGGGFSPVASSDNGSLNGPAGDADTPLPIGQSVSPKVAAGPFHSLALRSNGEVYAWGRNSFGELGRNSADLNEPLPKKVQGLSGVVGIAAGGAHSVALKFDGTLWTWGANQVGQLGHGNTDSLKHPTPTQVNLPGKVVKFAAGGHNTMVLLDNGQVRIWGVNTNGEAGLGNGSAENIVSPAVVSFPTGAAAIRDVGLGESFGIALDQNGAVFVWGKNNAHQLGLPESATPRRSPVKVNSPQVFDRIVAGIETSFLITGTGAVWGMGLNNQNVFADATGNPTTGPMRLSMFDGRTKVLDSGYRFSISLTEAGRIWSVGTNGFGQLCNLPNAGTNGGVGGSRTTLGELTTLNSVFDLGVGRGHVLILDSSHNIWACGLNEDGQLGDGSRENRDVPVRVSL